MDDINQDSLNDNQMPIQIIYDPQKFPPDIEIARKHGLSSQIGRPIESKIQDICPCCGYQIQVEKPPFCSDHKEFVYLGLGVPLFFQFLKWCGIFMLFGTLCFQIFGMIIHQQGDSCISNQIFDQVDEGCRMNQVNPCQFLSSADLIKVNKFSYGENILSDENCFNDICHHLNQICVKTKYNQYYFPNIQFNQDIRTTQCAGVLVFVILTVIMLVYMRHRQKLFQIYLDQGNLDANDFTVMIRHLPQHGYNEQELRDFLNKWWIDQKIPIPLEIANINIAFDIFLYTELINQKKQLLLKRNQILVYKQKHNNSYPKDFNDILFEQLENQISTINQEIQKIQYSTQLDKAHPSQICFVSFQTTQMMEQCLLRTQTNFIQALLFQFFRCFRIQTREMIFKGKKLWVQRAPDPTDIIWKNCGYTYQQQLQQRTYSHLITSLCLAIVFSIEVGLNFGQAQLIKNLQNKNDNNKWSNILSAFFSILVVAFNSILTILITKLTLMEKYLSQTYFNISMASTLVIAQLLNSAILTFVSNSLVSYYNSGSNNYFQIAIQKLGGIADQMFLITLSYIGSLVFELFFNPQYYQKLYMRWNIRRQQQDSLITQQEANQWFEGVPILLYQKYSYCLLGMFFTALYAPLVPELFLLITIGFFMIYWIEKFYFCNRYARPSEMGPQLNQEMIDLLDYFPLTLALGQFILDQIYGFQLIQFTLDLIALGIGLFFIILPIEYFNQKFFPVKIEDDDPPALNMNFKEASQQFRSHYDIQNPLTRALALEILQKQNAPILNDQQFQQLLNRNNLTNTDSFDQYLYDEKYKDQIDSSMGL